MRDWDPTEGVEKWARETGNAARRHGHDMTFAEAFKYVRLEED
jgi:hypothetical protein